MVNYINKLHSTEILCSEATLGSTLENFANTSVANGHDKGCCLCEK